MNDCTWLLIIVEQANRTSKRGTTTSNEGMDIGGRA